MAKHRRNITRNARKRGLNRSLEVRAAETRRKLDKLELRLNIEELKRKIKEGRR